MIGIGISGLWAARSLPVEPEEADTGAASTVTSTVGAVSPSTLPTTTTPTTTTAPSTTTTVPEFLGGTAPVDAERLAHSWHQGCPVGPDDLALITVTHRDFDGEARQGELVVHADHAEAVITVFQTLFDAGYPIESVVPIGDLPPGAESEPGYNNTSGFHCRAAVGSTNWSEHARGLAIDVNPHLNPYVRGDRIEPPGSERYLDRTLDEPGMITDGDEVVRAFEAIGWSWGGHWRSLKDYHHFSATGR